MQTKFVIGLLSGTSVDAIDAGLWLFNEKSAELVSSIEAKIGPKIREHILDLSTNGQCTLQELGQLDIKMGHLFASAVIELIKKSGINKDDILAIGSHGQTVWHEPSSKLPFSMQVGCPHVIAQQTQLNVIADFRSADIALGGQGAPLVPAFHKWAFQDKSHDRVIINIGGISNLSVLSKDETKPLIGYDTGPGNALMDAWCEMHTGKRYDKNGALAKQGKVIPELLDNLLSEPYFNAPFPKSTGKDLFNLNWLKPFLKPHYVIEDVQATLLALTSQSICKAVQAHFNNAQIFICGGGAYNLELMRKLKEDVGSSYQLNTLDNLGMSPNWVESACFAWLALQRIEGRVIDIAHVTGAKSNTLLGASYNITPVHQIADHNPIDIKSLR